MKHPVIENLEISEVAHLANLVAIHGANPVKLNVPEILSLASALNMKRMAVGDDSLDFLIMASILEKCGSVPSPVIH